MPIDILHPKPYQIFKSTHVILKHFAKNINIDDRPDLLNFYLEQHDIDTHHQLLTDFAVGQSINQHNQQYLHQIGTYLNTKQQSPWQLVIERVTTNYEFIIGDIFDDKYEFEKLSMLNRDIPKYLTPIKPVLDYHQWTQPKIVNNLKLKSPNWYVYLNLALQAETNFLKLLNPKD